MFGCYICFRLSGLPLCLGVTFASDCLACLCVWVLLCFRLSGLPLCLGVTFASDCLVCHCVWVLHLLQTVWPAFVFGCYFASDCLARHCVWVLHLFQTVWPIIWRGNVSIPMLPVEVCLHRRLTIAHESIIGEKNNFYLTTTLRV